MAAGADGAVGRIVLWVVAAPAKKREPVNVTAQPPQTAASTVLASPLKAVAVLVPMAGGRRGVFGQPVHKARAPQGRKVAVEVAQILHQLMGAWTV